MERIEVRGLKVEVGDKEVLRGVDLALARGQIRVVMGPNGSGKSTLAYALMGHPGYRVISGSVRIVGDGKSVDMLKLKPDERAKKGLFLGFQNPMSVPGVSVFNLLKTSKSSLSLSRRGTGLESVVQLYERVKKETKRLGLGEESLKRSVNDGFSGGEKKKVEALQLAVLRPKFAILDEPDTGLDVDALKKVAKVIEESAKGGTGILLITHYMRLLRYLRPEFVYVLKDGRVVRSGDYTVAKEVEKHGYEKVA